ncbi:MAG: hypothetical protein AAFY73_00135 [Pseudomonadota bacterium]
MNLRPLICLAAGLTLVGCTTIYSRSTLVGEFNFNGKKYDIYQAFRNIEAGDAGLVRVLMPKGQRPEDLGGFQAIAYCKEELFVGRERDCLKLFRTRLEERANRPKRDREESFEY